MAEDTSLRNMVARLSDSKRFMGMEDDGTESQQLQAMTSGSAERDDRNLAEVADLLAQAAMTPDDVTIDEYNSIVKEIGLSAGGDRTLERIFKGEAATVVTPGDILLENEVDEDSDGEISDDEARAVAGKIEAEVIEAQEELIHEGDGSSVQSESNAPSKPSAPSQDAVSRQQVGQSTTEQHHGDSAAADTDVIRSLDEYYDDTRALLSDLTAVLSVDGLNGIKYDNLENDEADIIGHGVALLLARLINKDGALREEDIDSVLKSLIEGQTLNDSDFSSDELGQRNQIISELERIKTDLDLSNTEKKNELIGLFSDFMSDEGTFSSKLILCLGVELSSVLLEEDNFLTTVGKLFDDARGLIDGLVDGSQDQRQTIVRNVTKLDELTNNGVLVGGIATGVALASKLFFLNAFFSDTDASGVSFKDDIKGGKSVYERSRETDSDYEDMTSAEATMLLSKLSDEYKINSQKYDYPEFDAFKDRLKRNIFKEVVYPAENEPLFNEWVEALIESVMKRERELAKDPNKDSPYKAGDFKQEFNNFRAMLSYLAPELLNEQGINAEGSDMYNNLTSAIGLFQDSGIRQQILDLIVELKEDNSTDDMPLQTQLANELKKRQLEESEPNQHVATSGQELATV